jgi:hypothetical protein
VGTWSSAALPGWSGLGNAYRKLGLAGRDQLAPALAVDLSPHPDAVIGTPATVGDPA